jgi:hypothetical protein
VTAGIARFPPTVDEPVGRLRRNRARDGKIVRQTTFQTVAEALEAAGLSE